MASKTKVPYQLSRYRILGLVGQGQFGQVFCAMHRKTGKLFALKNLERERFPTRQFLRELRFLLSLQHPNIVTCHAIEHTKTGRYLVMDYCEGGTLRSLMVDDIRLPMVQSLQIVTDVLYGLGNAHQQGIVHCDVKPENILLTLQVKGWQAKISDFGIARLNQEVYSQSTGNTGSPAYMAPERFYSQYSAASDIYAVGVLLYELLVGHRPFSGTPKALMDAHLNQSVACPNTLPIGLQGVISTALQKLPARRFQSATEMLEALKAAVVRTDLANWQQPTPIQAPLLILRQSIPYYDSVPQLQQGLDYSVNDLKGVLSSGGADHSGRQLSNGQSSSGSPSRGSPSTGQHQGDRLSHIGYAGSANFTYCSTAALSAVLLPEAGDRTTKVEWRSLRVPEPIQQLLSAPQGYFLRTQRTLFWVNIWQSPQNSEGKQVDNTPSAQPIYQLEQDCIAAVEPHGYWLALVTDVRQGQQDGGFSTLSFHPLPGCPGSMALPKSSIHLRIAGWAKSLLAAIALDSRHIAIISDGPPPKSSPRKRNGASATMNRATYIEVFTRRGQRIALQYLPMWLGTVVTTSTPYRLLATDRYDPTSVLCIDLKPFRIQRFVLDIQPMFLAATQWGYIIADADGHIVFLDTSGYAVSGLKGPAHLTSMTFLPSHLLLLTTWNGDSGDLHFLDLKQQMTNWVF